MQPAVAVGVGILLRSAFACRAAARMSIPIVEQISEQNNLQQSQIEFFYKQTIK